MEKLIGNLVRIIFKEDQKTIEGILINIDEECSYVQCELIVRVIPKSNILYYETNEIPSTSMVIEPEITMGVYIDHNRVVDLRLAGGLSTNEIISIVYENEIVQKQLEGKTQKTIECFDNAVQITTSGLKKKTQVSFTMDSGVKDLYLSPSDVVKKV